MLSEKECDLIKKLYVNEKMSVKDIMKILNNNITESMIRHYIQRSGLNRYSLCSPLTNEQKKIILSMNKNNRSCSEIEKVTGVNRKRINAFLHKQGLNSSFSIYKKITSDQIQDICFLYTNGMSAKNILKKYNDLIKSEKTIIKIIKDAGYKIRNRGHISAFINHNFFEEINSESKAYFLGWMISDGYVVKPKNKGYVIGLDVQSSDRYILEKFKECINLSDDVKIIDSVKPITQYRKSITYQSRLSFRSEKIASDLSKFNVKPKKSFKVQFPNFISNEFVPHIIRGIFDGDGCISGNLITFYGNQIIVEQIQNILITELKINKTKIIKRKGCYSFTFSSKKDVASFYKYIYKNATIYLTRKKDKFNKLEFINKKIC